MRTAYDLAPLYRSVIGVDRIATMIEAAMTSNRGGDHPPFNVEKTGNDSYRISMALAGFDAADLDITYQPNLLIVTGRSAEPEDSEYLYRGIAGRDFAHRFELDHHVVVKSATFVNGLLNIELIREIPEELKPRKIEIGATKPGRFRQLDYKKDDRRAA